MRRYILVFLTAAIAVFATSCKKLADPTITLKLTYEGETCPDSFTLNTATTFVLEYEIESLVESVVDVKGTDALRVGIPIPSQENPNKGTITLTVLPEPEQREDFLTITAHNDRYTKKHTIAFISELESMTADGSQMLNIGAEGGKVELKLTSNTEFDINIPEDAKSWLSYVNTKATAYTITLSASENNGFERTADVILTSVSKNLSLKYTIVQEGNPQVLSFVSTASTVTLPQFGGTNIQGHVYWTEGGDYVLWQNGLSKNYGNTSAHSVRVLTLNVNTVTFSNLSNIQKISIK